MVLCCKQCGKEMISIRKNRKFCEECNRERGRNRQRVISNSDITFNIEKQLKTCLENVNELWQLTSKGFEIYFNINPKCFTNYYKMKWINILQKYNKFLDLENYIINEVNYYYKINSKINIKDFVKTHKYLTQPLVESFDWQNILKQCNIKNTRYKENEFVNELINLKSILGRIPLFSEWKQLSKISATAYSEFFKKEYNKNYFKYDELIFNVFKDNQHLITEYKLLKKQRKFEILKSNEIMGCNKIDEKELEEEFLKVFNQFKEEYGLFPTRKLFSKASKYSERPYVNLFGSWGNACKYYGFKEVKYKFQYYVLNKIKNILNSDYDDEVCFKWLKSRKNGSLRCDGVFNEYNLIVEADGNQHDKLTKFFNDTEETFNYRKENDNIKDMEIPKHGYKLLRIKYNSNWQDTKYLKQKLIEIGINIPCQENIA